MLVDLVRRSLKHNTRKMEDLLSGGLNRKLSSIKLKEARQFMGLCNRMISIVHDIFTTNREIFLEVYRILKT
jgi:hypothetical protein